MADNDVKVEPDLAAVRFLKFVGATISVVAIVLLIMMDSHWFWLLFVPGWLIFFLGLWGRGVIKMGIEKDEAKKAAEADN